MAVPLKSGRETAQITLEAPRSLRLFMPFIRVPPVPIMSSAMKMVLPSTSPRSRISLMLDSEAFLLTLE